MRSAVLQPSAVRPRHDLRVEREDIRFRNITLECVHIEVTVRNDGEGTSPPTAAHLAVAPLGAFVAWRPLTRLRVPALEPGQSVVLRTTALRPAVAPLGPPDKVPPRRLLTALDQGDGPRPQPGTLTADLMDLLGRPGAHWAGNLNVFVGGRAVERHVAQALRVYPGRDNLAMFVVGSRRDEYRFELQGDGADWDALLFDGTAAAGLRLDGAGPVEPGEWHPLPGRSMMFLRLRPPQGCPAGAVEVHVTQRSSGETAVVEFSLDPRAAGPGCYTL